MLEIHDQDLVLVAVMPSVRDFEIARLLGWYRIPLKTAPKVIQVDYLAFYQTAAFGKEHQWRIEKIARLKGYELTTRREILRDEPEHPRADEEYFKLQIGPLEKLAQPILAGGWKRLTFLYTTGLLLKQARIVKDLVVKTEERQILWHALRERALSDGTYKPDDLPEFDLSDEIMALLIGSGLQGE